MSKKMRVVLEIEVDDLPHAERVRHAADMMEDENAIQRLADTSAEEAASVLDLLSHEGVNEMLFEGSDLFVQFVSAKVCEAQWLP